MKTDSINIFANNGFKNTKNVKNVFEAKNNDESVFSDFLKKDNGFVFDNKGIPFEDADFDFSRIHDIPEGHSRYEYNGAKYDIYRRGDSYSGQFVHPEDFSREDFYEVFPDLEPVAPSGKDSLPESKTTVSGINGEIDENTIQGSTGDCFLISALYSMANSESGKELLKDAIKVNDDNTVTVSFKGIGVSYTMTADEINQFDTDNDTSDAYSNGDNDVLAMEIAVQKLWKDMQNGRVTLNTNNKDLLYAGSGSGVNNGGLPAQLLYYMTGVEPNQLYNKDLSDLSKNQIYSELQKASQSDNYALTFGLYGNGHKAKLTNGETFELDLGEGGHALAITDVQKDTVTFVNPWDTSKKYTMSWEEFSKLGIGYMSSSDLTKTKQSANIKDMTDASNYISKNDDSSYGSSGKRYDDYSGRKRRFRPDNNNKGFNFFDYFNDLINDFINSGDSKKSKKGSKKAA